MKNIIDVIPNIVSKLPGNHIQYTIQNQNNPNIVFINEQDNKKLLIHNVTDALGNVEHYHAVIIDLSSSESVTSKEIRFYRTLKHTIEDFYR